MGLEDYLRDLIDCLKDIQVRSNKQTITVYANLDEWDDYRQESLRDCVNLFSINFFKIGLQASKENISSFQKIEKQELRRLIETCAQLIEELSETIYDILSIYKDSHLVDFDESIEGTWVCPVRSGVQFMFDLFRGCYESLDRAFAEIEDDVCKEYDSFIQLSIEHDTFDLKKHEIPTGVPESHYWWFSKFKGVKKQSKNMCSL